MYWGILAGLLAAGLVITKAFAASDCLNDATQEATAEIVECASYYLVVASGLKATPGQEHAATFLTDNLARECHVSPEDLKDPSH